MADTTYRVNIESRQAERALIGLQNTASGVTAALTALGGVLATGQLLDFADSITNVRNRLALLAPTQQAVNEQFQALSAIAITARTPLEQTADLYFRIARNAKELGISQQEAAQITESVAKALVSSGISAQEAAGPLLQLGQALASGRFQGDELRSILEGLPPVARALADQLGVPIGALKELGSQGKISAQDFINAMRAARDSIDQDFAKTAPTVGQALQQIQTAIALLFNEIMQKTGVSTSFATSLELLAANIYFLKDSIDEILSTLKILGQILLAIGSVTILGKLIKGFQAVRGAVVAAGGPLKSFVELLKKIGPAVGAFIGIDVLTEIFGDDTKQAVADSASEKIKKFREEMAKLKQNLPTEAGAGTPPFIDPTKLAKAREEIQKISEAYLRTLGDQQQRLELENSLVGASEEQKRVKMALNDLEQGYLKTVTDLMNKYREASISGKEEDAAKLKEIEAQLQTVSAAYGQQIEVVKNLTEENFRLNEAYKQRQALTDFAIRSELDLNKKIRDVQHEIATSTMSQIEKKYADIVKAANDSAQAAIEAENSRRRQLGIVSMTAAEEQEYRDAALKGTEELIALQRNAYEQSRQFSTGWNTAFRNYVDEATNAAKAAERIFQKATQGMEDLIVKFAKTGKFEFKSFVNSMLEELLRSQVRQMMAQIFNIGSMGGASGRGGGGGLLSSIGNLLGFANGGVIPTNRPVLVGERGPEIISGASGRVVTPNSQIGLGTTNVVYNISAVDARSFKDLVAQDPSFIYAVTQQGAKGIPGRR